MEIRIRPYILFLGQYVFSKEDLASILTHLGQNDSTEINQELFDLYRNKTDSFCDVCKEFPDNLQQPQDFIDRLYAYLKIDGVKFDFSQYCSIDCVEYIEYENGRNHKLKKNDNDHTYRIDSFYFSDLDKNSFFYIIITCKITKQIQQSVAPRLSFNSLINNKEYCYNAAGIIDLAQPGEKKVTFCIPAVDVLGQGKGQYKVLFGESVMAIIDIPRCGLPINGITSLKGLQQFCNKIDGKPTDELYSFYNLIKNRTLVNWLQDDDDEGKIKSQIRGLLENWEKENHDIKINDVNKVLEIISNRTVKFIMSDWFSVDIVRICSKNIVDNYPKTYFLKHTIKIYLYKYGVEQRGTLFLEVTPIKAWNIDFTIHIKTKYHQIGKPILINLSQIHGVIGYSYCQIIQGPIRKENKNVTHNWLIKGDSVLLEGSTLYISDTQSFKKTSVRMIEVGTPFYLPLIGDAISMAISYDSTTGFFGIAQNPLNIEQMKLIAGHDLPKESEFWIEYERYPSVYKDLMQKLVRMFDRNYIIDFPTKAQVQNAIIYGIINDYELTLVKTDNGKIHVFDLGLDRKIPGAEEDDWRSCNGAGVGMFRPMIKSGVGKEQNRRDYDIDDMDYDPFFRMMCQ